MPSLACRLLDHLNCLVLANNLIYEVFRYGYAARILEFNIAEQFIRLVF
ncbi:MAG: hypothetical protein A4E43_01167 [Methanosaeta sp. PtaB.Bin005]|nr:MAG: hypothetical protein A4E43_01167 [Methanosaeta sp. PtaB.Bin005]